MTCMLLTGERLGEAHVDLTPPSFLLIGAV